MSIQRASVGYDDLATLRLLALEGGLSGETKVSCASLSADMDVSTQTVSRRLQRLESGGLVSRDIVGDGQWVTVTDEGERALRAEYQAYRRLFESAGAVDLRGLVTSGMGEGRHYIALPGYRTQFEERLGYDPYPGTLNVALDDDSVRRRSALAAIEAVPIDGWEDDERTYGPAHCYPATLTVGDRSYENAHAIVPERTHHDEGQLEIIAPVRLRDELDLEDEDEVAITVGGGE